MLSVCKRLFGVLGLGLTVAVLAGPISQATPPRTYVRYLCDIDSVSYDRSTGIAEARLFVRIEHPTACQELDVSIEELRGVEYTGPMQWSGSAVMGEPWSTRLRLTVPYGDTTGIVVRTTCSEWGERIWPLYFVFPGGDSVGITDGDPREWPDPDPLPDSVLRRRDYEQQQRYIERMKQATPPPSGGTTRSSISIAPEDSALADSLSETGKRRLVVMRAKERRPLVDHEREFFEVGGRWFVRERGDDRFRRAETYTDAQIKERHERYLDSLKANPPGNVYHVYVNLSDPDDYEFVRSLVDSLVPTGDEGYYHIRTTKDVAAKIESRCIPHHIYTK